MRATPILLGAGLLAPALLATNPNRETVSFKPSEGTQLTRTFELSTVSDLDAMEMLMNGEEFPMAPQIEMTVTYEESLVVTDKLGAVADGRPASLVRTYDKIQHRLDMPMDMEVMGQAQNVHMQGEGASELEGKTVTFTWKDGEYAKAFAEGEEGDALLLEGLAEDLDLRCFLPAGDVSEGDSWDVDPAAVVDVLFAGGDLSVTMESTGDDDPMGGGIEGFPPPKAAWENLDGSRVSATFKSVRTEDDHRLAVIELELQLEATADMADFLREAMEDQMPEGMSAEINRADAESAFEGKGTLVWDLTAGHARSLEIEGDSANANSQAFSIDAAGQMMEITQTMEHSGTLRLKVTVE